jgi:molybdopterin-guanine dinucleotide biosynthesis protein A
MGHDAFATIVLVGGRSSRMGRPKAWLDLEGAPLLARVVEQVRTWSDEIVLIAAPEQDLPPLAGTPPRILHDDHPGAGPLPALAVGLEAVRASWALLLACDAPLVRTSVVARLAAERGTEVDAVVPIWDGRPQPLVALYRRALAPHVRTLVAAGERRMHVLAAEPRVTRIPEETLRPLDPTGESFRTVNTPEEFAAAAAIWRASRT